MTFEEFKNSVNDDNPPEAEDLIKALWYDFKGDWNMAHTLAQDVTTKDGAWVHAYLHRKESDDSNAAYWYHRAKQPVASGSLEHEWEKIARALLHY